MSGIVAIGPGGQRTAVNSYERALQLINNTADPTFLTATEFPVPPAVFTSPLPLANGGLGTILSAPAADAVWGYDLSDGASCAMAIGSGLTYTHATHTLSASGGGGTPGGADTYVQFNDAGAFGGTDALTFNKATGLLVVGKAALGNAVRLMGFTSGSTQIEAQAVAGSSVLKLPAATDTLVGKATTDTFTNKTLDSAGAGNSLLVNGVAMTDNTGTGKVVRDTSPALVTPDIGAATGTSLAATGALTSSSPSAGIGYATGAGGSTTQGIAGKNAAVTLNKLCGLITMNAANLNAGATVSFTFNNSSIAATDYVHVKHESTGTFGAYRISANQTAAGSCVVTVKNDSAGNLAEAIVLRFKVDKAVIT